MRRCAACGAAGRAEELEVAIRLIHRQDGRYVRIEIFDKAPARHAQRAGSADFADLDLPNTAFGHHSMGDGSWTWAEIDLDQ
ncbi:hypothetical protein [Actinomadura montaniterrae]|uniref:Uncharacterized protein n=1 Tax=Actinomadura montaniterrae TaxID=1803903 RepID=A0A6L3WA37_9ACTN|nr:hypothetical protein [Actinomadura montaniterrae]KAB2388849.1 hypothetical protein F9B16_02740 [Actinomadura montaniterrae]